MKTKNWSKYNYLFKNEEKYYLYNSLSNSFGELAKDSYSAINHFIDCGDVEILDQTLYEQLVKMKALVNNDQDEINKIKYITLSRRNDNRKLILTINPTLACNFACPYCFEKQHPNIFMDEITEDKIVNYIKNHKDAEIIDVTWFGGEPLLAFNRITSLTKKIQSLKLKYNASIITNGYLLNKNIAKELSSLSITFIQITIDGMGALHDKRRCLKSGQPTFETIIHNIDILKTLNPDIFVSIRVNIDHTNDDDFLKLYKFFQDKHYRNLSLSLAFVTDSSGCHSCETMYSRELQASFIKEMRNKYNLDFSLIYPRPQRNECAIRNKNAVVIGPEGELYKCWNDVGIKNKIIGNIEGKITNEHLLLRYLVGADPLEDSNCKKCLLFPVCGGGCPFSRILNEYEHKHINVCPLIKDHMEDFLLTHALTKNQY
ncbi:MAG: radical SAM protein [Prevotella histicola]|jgi:putative arylsulfatase regulator|uniref:radical SAM/SPASM domain-containing protein n=1 Tax=Prevotella histicola TaxID=470565 RepID=UPI001CABD0B9|nr:radical SAM protein [Prevotella histicola]MBF1426108.1 radical SAM protein [Prevotella histicola]